MKTTSVQKLARVLRAAIIAVFVCDIVAMLAVPVMALLTPERAVEAGVEGLGYLFGLEEAPEDYWPFTMIFFLSWLGVWGEFYTAALTVFLWACGICAAVILWQAKRVIDTVLEGSPFSLANAANMMRAAVCCFGISAAALIRLVWSMAYYHSAMPLVSYNTLFIPVFLVAGLVCIVMSALFRQASEMKAENDLTI